ncbi:MAG: hypothetical protein ABI137_12655 [Antricoccus sp.]
MSPILYAIGGVVFLIILVVLLVISRIKVAGPNQAFLVTGRRGRSVTGNDGSVSTDLSGQKSSWAPVFLCCQSCRSCIPLTYQAAGFRSGSNGRFPSKASSAILRVLPTTAPIHGCEKCR